MSDAERKPDEYPDLNVGAYMKTQAKVPLFSWKQEGSHIDPVEGLYKKPTETKVSWAMIMNAIPVEPVYHRKRAEYVLTLG